MSVLGAHVASTLGAFRATTLGARGAGEEPPLEPGQLFDVIYEGTITQEVSGDTITSWVVLMSLLPQYQVPPTPFSGFEWLFQDTYDPGSQRARYISSPGSIALGPGNVEARRDQLIAQGWTFAPPYTEAGYYALAPWTRGQSVGQMILEMPVRPVGKAFPCFESAAVRADQFPEGAQPGSARRPSDVNSDLQTSLRRITTSFISAPPTNPDTANTIGAFLGIDFGTPFPLANYDTGERFIIAQTQSPAYAPDVTPGSGTIEIQGVGTVGVGGSFRAICPAQSGAGQVEPVAIIAGQNIPFVKYFDLFNCIEFDTTTVQDPGYVDNGFVAGANGGFCIRYDQSLNGGLGAFDIYMTDTPKNADAKLGNSPNFVPNSWRTLYAFN